MFQMEQINRTSDKICSKMTKTGRNRGKHAGDRQPLRRRAGAFRPGHPDDRARGPHRDHPALHRLHGGPDPQDLRQLLPRPGGRPAPAGQDPEPDRPRSSARRAARGRRACWPGSSSRRASSGWTRTPAHCPAVAEPGVTLGAGLCDAFEAYLVLHPEPQLSFEWAWNLYRCLVSRRELRLVWCALCEGPYVQDAYALDYERCPFCELKDHA